MFSSPFIEERLYLLPSINVGIQEGNVLVPFYRGAVVFKKEDNNMKTTSVLVPFYRGAVVFKINKEDILVLTSSRPLLSRSGCIFHTLNRSS